MGLGHMLGTAWDLADALLQYTYEKYDEDPRRGSRQQCVNARCAIIFVCPHLKGAFGEVGRALKGWDKLVESTPAFPATEGYTLAIAHLLMTAGEIEAGILSLLSFDCYLRAHEALALSTGDVVWAGDPRLGKTFRGRAGIRIDRSKTGKNQFVVLRSELVARLLGALIARRERAGHKRLFDSSYHKYLANVHWAADRLGFPPLSPHSFRRGGATQDRLNGESMAYIQERGRWASAKTCKKYVDTARGLVAADVIAPVIARWMVQLRKAPLFHFRAWG